MGNNEAQFLDTEDVVHLYEELISRDAFPENGGVPAIEIMTKAPSPGRIFNAGRFLERKDVLSQSFEEGGGYEDKKLIYRLTKDVKMVENNAREAGYDERTEAMSTRRRVYEKLQEEGEMHTNEIVESVEGKPGHIAVAISNLEEYGFIDQTETIEEGGPKYKPSQVAYQGTEGQTPMAQ